MVRLLVPVESRQADNQSPLRISDTWQLLGPFQIGTREGSWGADPLEYHGGFRNLQYDPDTTFRTSLATNGVAKWSKVQAAQTDVTSNSTKASLSVGYDNVNWDFLKVVYGWAAVQYQAWARGELVVSGNKTQQVVLHTDAIIEYWIDDVHYFGGDAYTFRKAPPVLSLTPGAHKVDIRLWRDVRAFGGINDPTIDVLIEARLTSGTLELATPGILISDVVDGQLASPHASVIVRNGGSDDVEITSIRSIESDSPAAINSSGITVIAGQTRPISFSVTLPGKNASSIHYIISYRVIGHGTQSHVLGVSQQLTKGSIYNAHKFTFLHPGGVVSYAMLRPPAKNVTCEGVSAFPVLVANHGAGVEVSDPMAAHVFDALPDLCAWVLLPSGVTPWSGDDWHNWGFTDLEAAVASIPHWIEDVSWGGPGVDVDRWIMTGHSNGGQGTWYGMTHRPDRLIAAAPLSGYSSIQKYVPYELWQPADPRRTAILSASLNSYRHEILLENLKGIPVLQQHGEIDDNVPTYHSRFLGQQLFQAGANSTYNEVPGQNHWWDGIMTTDPLKKFFRSQATSDVTIPRKLDEFSFIIGDPGDMGPKGGIRVLQLEDPGQYGKVHVKGHVLTTTNVLSLEIDIKTLGSASLSIDADELSADEALTIITKGDSGRWSVGEIPNINEAIKHRRGRQLGTMTAILRTKGPFIIRHHGSHTIHTALQVSRNFHQYFYADSVIASSNSTDDNGRGNTVTVVEGHDVPPGLHENFPISISASTVSVTDSKGRIRKYGGASDVGAIYLRPLEDERLELVVWGSSAEALSRAARLVPMMTGVGQPDFVILGDSAAWRGVEGALALGFFDHWWAVTTSSVVS
ncbi:hypothetical protein BU24DRAFT_422761 [Aaosphaeria arxii CBS 175.79]|uniref:Peptidase S9 prolyl oligopeptidase catalytic domain-containing protein n=1 Tax=Aaosphaeria arxii CBS 175.79 TaxID=1450172 RepID=A0A6A5XUN1_9PLEO|nr:uncharacterized protein BU24DRAFT_422761 [Aaosphaeria arxii CBS 175.79]KAF2016421.1 hypothetical protein BU24DRAFT_422761 [Aaosphaeria arxii CBS 175.79]